MTSSHLDPRSASAADVTIGLDCPTCRAPTRVSLAKLGSLIRCKECQETFAIGPGNVTVAAKAKIEKPRRVECPRCRESQTCSVPSGRRSTLCEKCGAEIPLRSAPPTESAEVPVFLRANPDGAAPAWVWVALFGVTMVLVGASVWWISLPPIEPRLSETATRFTLKLLQGESEEAQSLVEPNQGSDFRQWVRLDVTNALESGSLQGDARLGLRFRDEKDGLVWLEAELAGVGRNRKVVLLQGWRRVLGGDWRFDAAKTIARTRSEAPVGKPGSSSERQE